MIGLRIKYKLILHGARRCHESVKREIEVAVTVEVARVEPEILVWEDGFALRRRECFFFSGLQIFYRDTFDGAAAAFVIREGKNHSEVLFRFWLCHKTRRFGIADCARF